jgi:CO/xanthine dehydrogenase FAD-binding subunit
MKAAPFEYSRPVDLDEACALLVQDEGARVIAGGQTLIPMMAMRLARPTRLVDISRIGDLAFIREDGDSVVIGATTRQARAERDELVRTRLPLLAAALPWVGHPPTRARGTVGGSLANADPSAEIALIAVTLGATLVYREDAETSEVPASEYFFGPMITALPSAACLTEVRFPTWSGTRVGVGFREISSRRSDFALVAVAAQVALDAEGACERVALGAGGIADTPIGLDSAVEALSGSRLDEAEVREAVRAALEDVETVSDLHASGDYRRRVACSLMVRAVADARAAARGQVGHAH